MKRKDRLHLILIMAGMFLGWFLPPFHVHAAEAGIINTTVYEGDIYIYVRGITQVQDGISVQIGNTVCSSEQVSAVSFQDMETSVKTLVLIDNSKSISEKGREDIHEIMEGLIAASLENEQIKIGTFSDRASYLCDYTGDKDILNNVINGISYYDQDSFLSDVLYDEMNTLTEKETGSCMRILVISDGADDNSIGYTNDEIRSYIEENSYQVYTVGIPGKDNSRELEALFSFSRAAKSPYFLMDGSVAAEDVVNTLRQDQEGICLRITPDESLKDGSEKNILLRLDSPEGSVQLTTTNVQMPFGTGLSTNAQVSEETEETEASAASGGENEKPEVSGGENESPGVSEGDNESPEVSDEENESPEEAGQESAAGSELPDLALKTNAEPETDAAGIPLFPVIAGVIVAVAAAVTVTVILVFRKKKKQKATEKDSGKTTDDRPSDLPEKGEIKTSADTEDTLIRPKKAPEEDSGLDDTEGIWLGGASARYYLVLRCVDIPNIMYKVPIEEKINIGRAKTSDIVLDDPEVSRNHCEIYLRGSSLYVKDCDSVNHTFYEGASIYGEVPVTSGGKLEIGAHIYSVELVKES